MNFGLWWRTIRDLPPQQIAARIQFEIRRRSFPNLPLPLRCYFTFGIIAPTPPLNINYLNSLHITTQKPFSLEHLSNHQCSAITLTFLNETRTLPLPISWNSPHYSRLWQFNLHYFDWIRDRLTTAYQQKKITESSFLELYSTITDWIDHNEFYAFDGWHPYTTSLRIVNWTYAIHAFPELQTSKIIDSLWEQINYLYHNKEYFAGGNHLLENLRALIIGGLNFDHPKAQKIVQSSLQELAQQLSHQILPDGGHYERSPMYHLIVMNLLGESIACLYNAHLSAPSSILNSLGKMLEFSQGMRLQNGDYPLWNDAAYHITYSLDQTISWIRELINSPDEEIEAPLLFPCNALHLHLLNKNSTSIHQSFTNQRIQSNPTLIDQKQSYHAPDTGYSILRNYQGIELGFDYGLPCPPELPPHAHADCLTLDLYYQSQPIIVDTGTSEYKQGFVRKYERSTRAHNTIEIAQQNQSEVWGSFRVGRKAQPLNITSGVFKELQWISASHNGYYHSPLQSIHHRWIGIENTNIIILDIIETDKAKISSSNLYGISRFHFAPHIDLSQASATGDYCHSSKNLNLWIKTFDSTNCSDVQWLTHQDNSSWYSPEFGKRISRGCLEIKTPLDQPHQALLTFIGLQSLPTMSWQYNPSNFELTFSQMNLKWTINQSKLIFQAKS